MTAKREAEARLERRTGDRWMVRARRRNSFGQWLDGWQAIAIRLSDGLLVTGPEREYRDSAYVAVVSKVLEES